MSKRKFKHFPLLDLDGKPVDVSDESKTMANLDMAAEKRTRYLRREVLLNKMSFEDAMKGAYIQGLTDASLLMEEAVVSTSTSKNEQEAQSTSTKR